MKTITFALNCLFFSSLIYMITPYGKYFILASLIIIPMPFIFKKSYKIKVEHKQFFAFLVYFFTGVISSLINKDIDLLLGMFVMLILYLTLSIFLPSAISYKDYNRLINKVIVSTHIPIIFLPLITDEIMVPYMGIFNNGNSFGIAVAMLFSVYLAKVFMFIDNYISNKRNKDKKFTIIFYILMIFILFILGIYSGSRTTTLTNILVFVFSFFLIVIKVFKDLKIKYIKRLAKIITYLLIIITLAIVMTPLRNIFINIFINKFIIKINQGNVLSYRQIVWRQTINDAKLFGNGRDYFQTSLDIGAHNTFISLLGQYGWIVLVTFLIILIISFRYAYIYSMEAIDDDSRFLPIIIWMSFFFLSMGEGMILKVNMIGTFCGLGITSMFLKEKKRNIKI